MDEFRTLILDIGYQPIKTVGWQHGLTLLFKKRARLVVPYEGLFIRSPSVAVELPAVVTVPTRPAAIKHPRYTRRNLFLRDEGMCQYCGLLVEYRGFTLDHVLPRLRGGRSEWSNVVVCCRGCNETKGDKSPAESGLRLKRIPKCPGALMQAATLRLPHGYPQEWRPYV